MSIRKAVLLSIKPNWCELIANGQKTIEVRKTRPNLGTPFKCYIYCTKGPLYLNRRNHEIYLEKKDILGGRGYGLYDRLNGKVIGEFVCDRTEDTLCFSGWECPQKRNIIERFKNGSCITEEGISEYAKGGAVCAWHISALKVYDKPKEITDFTRLNSTRFGIELTTIERPPQSWLYVEERTW